MPRPGAKHRHDDDVGRHAARVGRAERRLDRRRRDRDVAQRFGREQDADARRDAPELIGRRPLVAQLRERVVHERVIDECSGTRLT